jgi:signal peptidase II
VFTITHVQNTGVAFGQLAGLGWIFMLVNIGVLIGVLVFYPRIPARQWQLRLASALLLTGALGNITDRLRTALLIAGDTGSIWQALPRAYVTDFVDFKVWPVWNIADLCVVSGVAILAWTLWQAEKSGVASEAIAEDR